MLLLEASHSGFRDRRVELVAVTCRTESPMAGVGFGQRVGPLVHLRGVAHAPIAGRFPAPADDDSVEGDRKLTSGPLPGCRRRRGRGQ
ncbi:hypothetical protein PV341_02560 [Streptomyces sp. PA03-1a]|nr:hypothetical protein [Streptomyces sp. PA03-1a]MDX2816129.1 hypothetical protein [Streptomyces sp. PA03-5A]